MEVLEASSLLCGLLDIDILQTNTNSCWDFYGKPKSILFTDGSDPESEQHQELLESEEEEEEVNGVYCKASRHTTWRSLQKHTSRRWWKRRNRKWTDMTVGPTSCLCDYCLECDEGASDDELHDNGINICTRKIFGGMMIRCMFW